MVRVRCRCGVGAVSVRCARGVPAVSLRVCDARRWLGPLWWLTPAHTEYRRIHIPRHGHLSISRTPSLHKRIPSGFSLVPSTPSAFLPHISILFCQSRSSTGGIPPAADPAGAAPPPGEVTAGAFPTQSVVSPSVSPLALACAIGASGREPHIWSGGTCRVQGVTASVPREQG